MKKIIAILLAAMMVCSLAACGSSASSSAAPSSSGASSAQPSEAAAYPTKNIQGSIMWSAGGICDTISRAAGLVAQEELGQSIVFTNRAGSGGGVSTAYVNAQAADGYELLFGAETPQIAKVTGTSELDYDDFYPICLLSNSYGGIFVAKDSKYQTLEELINDMLANPGKVIAATTGAGGLPETAATIIRSISGTEANMVPFDGENECAIAVMGGNADFAVSTLGSIASFALQSLQCGLHREVAEATHGMLVQDLDHVHDLPGRTDIAQTPACHGRGLGKAIDGDHVICPADNGRWADVLGPVIDDGTVHLVGQDEQAVIQGKVHHAFGLLLREDTAGGVVGVVDDQQPGTGRDRLFQGFPGDTILLFKVQLHAHRHTARRRHNGCVGDPTGVQDHDLLPLTGVDERADGLVDGAFAAGRHQDMIRGAGNAPVLPQHPGDALPQRTDAPRFRIVGAPLGDGTDAAFSCTVRRIKVRFSSGQRDDMLSGSPHGLCPFINRHRRGRRYSADGLIK